jgi:4-hydroxy-3-methylbut-2-enyl diphosphate reductase IspH
MQRFHPTPRPNTLHDKVMKDLSETRFMQPAAAGPEVRIATALGMDADARAALDRLTQLAKSRKIGVAGRFMPDSGVSARLVSLGIVENVDEADFFKFRAVVIPFSGIGSRQRRDWEEAGYPMEDLTSPQVRRAQVALGLLKMEGAQALVIGRHDDAESLAIAGGNSGTRILQDTTDTARLLFAPAFGVVCQTTLSPRRVSWLVQQLRLRWRDARVTFLDTVSSAMTAREEALERLLVVCDRAVIVGEAGESSCEALLETAMRRGKPAVVVATPEQLDTADFRTNEKVALTAGAFATDEAIRAVAETLVGR